MAIINQTFSLLIAVETVQQIVTIFLQAGEQIEKNRDLQYLPR